MNVKIEIACKFGLALFLLAATPLLAGEPSVLEQTRPDGFTELRIVSDGKTNATYRVDLKNHHEPATTPAGPIKQWESYRFGALVHFNDNQIEGREFSENTDGTGQVSLRCSTKPATNGKMRPKARPSVKNGSSSFRR